jgi:hypothetical protein
VINQEIKEPKMDVEKALTSMPIASAATLQPFSSPSSYTMDELMIRLEQKKELWARGVHLNSPGLQPGAEVLQFCSADTTSKINTYFDVYRLSDSTWMCVQTSKENTDW